MTLCQGRHIIILENNIRALATLRFIKDVMIPGVLLTNLKNA